MASLEDVWGIKKFKASCGIAIVLLVEVIIVDQGRPLRFFKAGSFGLLSLKIVWTLLKCVISARGPAQSQGGMRCR
ncbi:hypothetical protein A2U01_0043934 [Trifolium medium]|uniref:Uncharacterized protein n=1 Tax=Trifolium medium TaxID=97028 RepID=A0A392QF30_9FABA|nr:hypothetical protein [Trifolium medium]